ncbi:MAG: PBP1A family penicillin-binding protein [Caulobacteraceae bacterium]
MTDPLTPSPGPARPGRKPRPILRGILIAGLILLVIGAVAAAVGGTMLMGTLKAWRDELPQITSQEQLWTLRRAPGMTFLDRTGKVLAVRGPRYATAVRLGDLPPFVTKAFLAAEDRRFYEHGPMDYRGIARAVWMNIKAGRTTQGASTLSQQLARTLFLSQDQTLKRKIQEIIMAARLEDNLGKDGVLELYLNRTFFGDNAYGVEAAAFTYFGKSARNLTLAESALLAAIPNAPSRLALTNDMQAALARSHRILNIMAEEGWVTEAEARRAIDNPPRLRPPPPRPGEGEFAYVIDLAARQASAAADGSANDLIVRLTIDPGLQKSASEILRAAITGQGRARNATQGALVALAPDGAIRAMVGGVNHDTSPFNRAFQAHRQPGSSFKPIVFAAALERGVNPSDVREDGPVRVGNWRPQNYGGGYSGRVTIQQALARSINTVAVRLALEMGPGTLASFAHRFGLSDIPSNAGPSLALGAYEVTPLALAGAYQVFQTGGGRTTPYLISEITNTRGDVIWRRADASPPPVYDRFHASQMVRMMETVITAGTGRRADIGRPAAGKTGTSQDWRDAWFVGFTPDYLCAVWVGNDNNRSMAHVTGGEIPAEIWARFMRKAHEDLPARDFDWLMPEADVVPDYAGAPDDPYEEGPGQGMDDPYADEPYSDEGAPRRNNPYAWEQPDDRPSRGAPRQGFGDPYSDAPPSWPPRDQNRAPYVPSPDPYNPGRQDGPRQGMSEGPRNYGNDDQEPEEPDQNSQSIQRYRY